MEQGQQAWPSSQERSLSSSCARNAKAAYGTKTTECISWTFICMLTCGCSRLYASQKPACTRHPAHSEYLVKIVSRSLMLG
eukprot:38482-Eustigmatos_ZCMA.PRE.1